MWPWEHLAVAYLAYSGLARVRTGRGPTAGAVAALVVGSQFPDLVDKPLAWQFGVLPAGWSLTHSLLVAVPLSLAVLAVCRRLDRAPLGTAFAVGYLLHLPADVLYPVLFGGDPVLWFLAWPVVAAPPQSGASLAFVPRVARLVAGFVDLLASPRGTAYVLGELVLVGSAAAVWVGDGAPLYDVVRRRVGVVRRRVADRHSR